MRGKQRCRLPARPPGRAPGDGAAGAAAGGTQHPGWPFAPAWGPGTAAHAGDSAAAGDGRGGAGTPLGSSQVFSAVLAPPVEPPSALIVPYKGVALPSRTAGGRLLPLPK